MGEKTRVHITSFDGHELNFEGDTVIVFTVDKPSKITDGEQKGFGTNANCAYVGDDIKEMLFGKIIADLVSGLIQKRDESNNSTPAMTALHLHEIASSLQKRSEEIIENLSAEESKKCLSDLLAEAFKSIFR